ncbi:RING-H2 finger ATL79-like [Olea europaea subsp. europaea]|uniref:RING-type E3 ubiquitin transferase n=1 Tax=Olea europaea subsp. europaea TaxID=158383 RepID=A0A8S0U4E6_OLEEU|nr:RING-H2 finger ATL79-like [Olea europaea subsp. europaea]
MKLKSVYFLGRAPAEIAEFNTHLLPPIPAGSGRVAPPPGAAAKCDGDAHRCPWWPYTNSKDFKENTALILIVLIIALICALAFNAAIRYIIRMHCCRRRRNSLQLPVDHGNVEMAQPKTDLSSGMAEMEEEIMAKVYSSGTKLAGEEAECTICLSEFADGEKIRVLEKCSHGFHLQCIQQWLVAHTSCPTCRASCTLT